VRLALLVVVFACGRDAKPEQQPTPAPAAATAEPSALQAKRNQARSLADEADAIDKALAELDTRVTTLDASIIAASTEAERAAARAQLDNERTTVNGLAARTAALADGVKRAREDRGAQVFGDAGAAAWSDADRRELDDAYKSAQDSGEHSVAAATRADELTKRLAKASDDLATKQNDADRAAAKAKLEELRREQQRAKVR